MEFLRADADFRAETELKTVAETAGGINIDTCCIDTRGEYLRMLIIICYDDLRVLRRISADMCNRFLETIHHFYR